MSDFNSALPVRSETAGSISSTIVDATIPSQGLAIDSTGKPTTKLNDGNGNAVTSQTSGAQRALDVGVNVAGVQVDPRQTRALTATDVVTANQGTASAIAGAWPVKPTDGTNSQSYTAAGESKVSVTQPLPAGTNNIGKVNVQDGAGNALTSVVAGATRSLDVALRDSSGNLIDPRLVRALTSSDVVTANIKDATGLAFSSTNPLPVAISQDNAGQEVNNYSTTAAVAVSASATNTYTVTTGKTLLLTQVEASGSGRMRIEVAIETGSATGVYTTKFVQFNSASSPNTSLVLKAPITVAAGVRVRLTLTNLDKAAQDLYSTIVGNEVP